MRAKGKKVLMWAVVLAGVYFFWDKINSTVGGAIASIKAKTGGSTPPTTGV